MKGEPAFWWKGQVFGGRPFMLGNYIELRLI